RGVFARGFPLYLAIHVPRPLLYHGQEMPRIPALILLAALLLTPALPQDSSSKTKHPDNPAAQDKPPPASAETVYRNPEFGFAYKVPYAWVDRTREMQDDSDP